MSHLPDVATFASQERTPVRQHAQLRGGGRQQEAAGQERGLLEMAPGDDAAGHSEAAPTYSLGLRREF